MINDDKYILSRCQGIGCGPTSDTIASFLIALTKCMMNVITKENSDGMGLIGTVMADNKYAVKSTNYTSYTKPVDPVLPQDVTLAGGTT